MYLFFFKSKFVLFVNKLGYILAISVTHEREIAGRVVVRKWQVCQIWPQIGRLAPNSKKLIISMICFQYILAYQKNK